VREPLIGEIRRPNESSFIECSDVLAAFTEADDNCPVNMIRTDSAGGVASMAATMDCLPISVAELDWLKPEILRQVAYLSHEIRPDFIHQSFLLPENQRSKVFLAEVLEWMHFISSSPDNFLGIEPAEPLADEPMFPVAVVRVAPMLLVFRIESDDPDKCRELGFLNDEIAEIGRAHV
jgi:hypothetical protein